MGRVAVKYLADLSEAAIVSNVLHQWLDKLSGLALKEKLDEIGRMQ